MASKYYGYEYRLALSVIFAMILLLALNGCGPEGVRTVGGGVTPTDGQISKENLRQQLDKFSDFFKARFRQMSADLCERVPSKRTEKTTLQMSARMLHSLNAMLDQDDPIVAFIETWALCTRLRAYLEDGEGATLYGDGQDIAVSGAKRLEAEIERIGHVFLKDDEFDTAKKNVTEFANANPIKGTFSGVTVFATEPKKDQPNPFMSIIKIPMTPFRAIEGVDRTALAVHRFTDTAERFSDILAELPESSRWQLQLLLYDLEETDMTKTFLASLTQFSDSSSRLAKSVEELPEQLREQLSQFVEEVDSKQANLQKTLERAEKTTLAVGDALEKLDKTTASLGKLTKDVTETAQAWESAAKVTGDVAREYNKKKEPSGQAKSFDVKEYRAAAEQTSQAANDIKSLLTAIEDFSKSRSYNAVIDAVTFRAVGFVLLIFALAVIYRIISTRLVRVHGGTAVTKAVNGDTRKRQK